MGKPWTLEHVTRERWAITNRSGHTARAVTFAAKGALVIQGDHEWAVALEQVKDGEGYPVTGRVAWGGDKPQIRVTWVSDHEAGHRRLTTLDWPT